MNIRHALFRSILTGLALVASFNVFADSFIVTDDELDAAVFPEVADSLRVILDSPEAPQGLSSARKRDVLRTLDRLESLVAENDPEGNRRKIRSAQARINAALAPTVARNDTKSEVICRRVNKVGSNIPTTECRTREEMEREKHLADEQLQRLQQGHATNGR